MFKALIFVFVVLGTLSIFAAWACAAAAGRADRWAEERREKYFYIHLCNYGCSVNGCVTYTCCDGDELQILG